MTPLYHTRMTPAMQKTNTPISEKYSGAVLAKELFCMLIVHVKNTGGSIFGVMPGCCFFGKECF